MRTLIVLTIFCLISSPVFALDSGECGKPEQIMAKLKAEDQHTVLSANRMEFERGMNVMYGIAVTTNSDRSVGYIVQSDKEMSDPPTRTCIYKRLANLRLFDASKPGVPQDALLAAPDEDALRRCDELIRAGKFEKKTCAPYNVIMRKREPVGERIAVQGFNVERKPDGTYVPDGTMATITGNVTGHMSDNPDEPWQGVVSGIFFTSLPDGATIINMTLAFAKYTEYGSKMVSRNPR